MSAPESASVRPAPRLPEAGSAAPGEGKEPSSQPPRVAIVGVPGSGKSLLFERLSGRHWRSAGHPFTSAALSSAEIKLGGVTFELVDTPGLTGLEFCSEDEAVTRALLQERPPDRLILCIDADNLVRSLVLAAQLADLELPTVVALTMVDEALGRGLLVDPAALAERLGVPVVPVCSVDGRGVRGLTEAATRPALLCQVPYPEALQCRLGVAGQVGAGGGSRERHAGGGPAPARNRAEAVSRLLRAGGAALPGQSLWHMVQEAHHHWARETASRVTRPSGLEPRRSFWDRVGELALHPLGSWIFLLGTLVAGYLLVSRVGVVLLAGSLERYVAEPLTRLVVAWTGPGWLHELLVGNFGLLSLGLLNALCTVLPILVVFHLVFALLEEVGYFPLLAIQFDRLLRSFGLTGRAVLPITLGFGCNSVAIMATRCLESPRQRLIASFLIAFSVPCAVQMGVILAILSTVPLAALLGFVGLVVALSLLSSRLLASLLPRGEQGELLVELRRLRAPSWRTVAARTWRRMVDFFRELLPIFVVTAGVLQLLQWTGLLERLRQAMAPLVVTALGLPREGADVLLMSLARREVAAVMMKEMVERGSLSLEQVMVGLTVMTLFVPCTNSLLVLGRVLGGRRAALIVFAVLGIALGVGSLMHLFWSW